MGTWCTETLLFSRK